MLRSWWRHRLCDASLAGALLAAVLCFAGACGGSPSTSDGAGGGVCIGGSTSTAQSNNQCVSQPGGSKTPGESCDNSSECKRYCCKCPTGPNSVSISFCKHACPGCAGRVCATEQEACAEAFCSPEKTTSKCQ